MSYFYRNYTACVYSTWHWPVSAFTWSLCVLLLCERQSLVPSHTSPLLMPCAVRADRNQLFVLVFRCKIEQSNMLSFNEISLDSVQRSRAFPIAHSRRYYESSLLLVKSVDESNKGSRSLHSLQSHSAVKKYLSPSLFLPFFFIFVTLKHSSQPNKF